MNQSIFEKQKRTRWTYMVTGVILLLFLGLIYAWSVFRIPLENEFGWSKADTSVIFSISMIMFCFGGLISGIVTGKKGSRFTLLCCAVFLAAGFIGASRIHSLIGIYVTYGGLCGFGVGLGYNATISTVVKWFPDKQGLISGITLMGFGFGGMILGTIGAKMIVSLGWRSTFVIFGGMFACIVVLGAFLLKPVTYDFLDQLASTSKKPIQALEELNYTGMLRRKNFWFYFTFSLMLSAAGLAVINISASYAGDILGGELTQAAAIAGIISVTNGFGRVLSGQLFDMKGYRITMFVICIMMTAAAGILFVSELTRSMPVLVMAFVLLGLAYGSVPPINSAFTAYFFGSKNYALNYSMMNLCLLPASVLGPMCANGPYQMTFVAMLIFTGIGFAVLLLIRKPKTTAAAGTADSILIEK